MSEVSSNSEEMGLVKIESEEVEPEIGTGKQKVTPILIPDQNGDVHGSNGVMTPAVALPSLRGRQLEVNATRVFRGLWAMSDYAHTLSGQTSDWEYRLVEPSEGAEGYPVTGKYVGWFNLKHPAPRPGHVRIDERDIYLSFSNDGAGGYKVSGEGQNKFGKFTVHGTLSQDGDLQLYKAYKLKPKPVGNTPKFARTPSNGLTPSSDLTPREARVRKPSAVLSAALETTEVLAAPKSARRVSESTAVSAPVPVAPVQATTPKVALAAAPPVRDSGRAVRLPLALQKCADLLKELQRHIHGAYFREPVDYVKLCIPDYPDIIKEPMDFHTIQCNLEKSLYFTHEAFAEHVRLVFKNAIAYNQRRDHPVNIAARELSSRFEERYRILLSQLNNEFETDIKAFTVGTERPVAKKSKSVGYRHSMGSSVRAATAGPREAIVPPALDAGMQALIEMQRTMKSMQEEILQLRTQLRQNDIKSSIEVQRQAAQVPMTFEEKQALVERINLLDEDRMKEVIEVVQEAFPAAANSDSDDVDIPIDDLDTLTLRRLQAIVSKTDKPEKRKRAASSNVPKQPGVKRSKSTGAVSKQQPVAVAPIAPLGSVSNTYIQGSQRGEFFTGRDDEDLLSNDEPVSMDTALLSDQNQVTGRDRGYSVGDDYSDLILEVTGGSSEQEIIVQNLDSWTSGAISTLSAQEESGTSWSEQEIKEKNDSQRLENVRKLEDEKKREALRSSFSARPIDAAAVVVSGGVSTDDSEIQRRREEEHRLRMEMGRTVNLDEHREALSMLDSNN